MFKVDLRIDSLGLPRLECPSRRQKEQAADRMWKASPWEVAGRGRGFFVSAAGTTDFGIAANLSLGGNLRWSGQSSGFVNLGRQMSGGMSTDTGK